MKFQIRKTMEVSASHRLDLPYESKCNNDHGHNYTVKVTIEGRSLNTESMLADYGHIKEVIKKLDHQNMNPIIKGFFGNQETRATAELIALMISIQIQDLIKDHSGLDFENMPLVSEVYVSESQGNEAWVFPLDGGK